MNVGVLDFGITWPGQHCGKVLSESISLAMAAEELGYERYWLAENHSAQCAWSSPEVIIPAIARETSRIRVGTAGILLHFYSSLKVASQFRALSLLFPDRIDLGVAAGMPRSEEVRAALVPGFDPTEARESQRYRFKVRELLGYCEHKSEVGSPFDYVRYDPSEKQPQRWVMGSGSRRGGMIVAAETGASFCYSGFHANHHLGKELIAEYKASFQTHGSASEAIASMAFPLVCTPDSSSLRELQSVVDAHSPIEPFFCGTPHACSTTLLTVALRFALDEIVISPLAPELPQRRDALEHMSREFGLS